MRGVSVRGDDGGDGGGGGGGTDAELKARTPHRDVGNTNPTQKCEENTQRCGEKEYDEQ